MKINHKSTLWSLSLEIKGEACLVNKLWQEVTMEFFVVLTWRIKHHYLKLLIYSACSCNSLCNCNIWCLLHMTALVSPIQITRKGDWLAVQIKSEYRTVLKVLSALCQCNFPLRKIVGCELVKEIYINGISCSPLPLSSYPMNDHNIWNIHVFSKHSRFPVPA